MFMDFAVLMTLLPRFSSSPAGLSDCLATVMFMDFASLLTLLLSFFSSSTGLY